MRRRTLVVAVLLSMAAAEGVTQAPPALTRGRQRLDAGDWAGALVLLRGALAVADTSAQLHSALARAYSELGEDAPAGSTAQESNYDRALAHARRGMELAPGWAQAHLDVAIATGKIATVSGASTKLKLAPVVAEEAREALRLDPRAWQAYHVLGQWNLEIATLGGFQKLGASLLGGLPEASLEDAIANFENARELEPGSVRNALALGRAYAEADRPSEARAELERGLELPVREPRDGALRREIRRELAELDS